MNFICQFILILVSFGSSIIAFASSGNFIAHVEYEDNQEKKVKGLEWRTPATIEVFPKIEGDQIKFYVVIEGTYSRANFIPTFQYQQLTLGAKDDFSEKVFIDSDEKLVPFSAIGPMGDVQTEKVKITVPDYALFRARADNEMVKNRFGYSVNMGPTALSYKQTGVPNHNQIAMTARISGLYKLNSKWEASANSYLNLFTLASSQPDSIRFLGINGRVGYVIHAPLDRWSYVINAGWYYVTTFADYVGFQNLSGPQAFPMVRYSISDTQSAYGYFKYSPVANSLSLLDLGNREIAFGGGYSFPWKNRSWTASLDTAFLSIENFNGISNSVDSLSLSLSLNF